MADYTVTGKKRNGKTLFVVKRIQEALQSGKRVATNIDIYVEHLLPSSSRAFVLRLPDRPSAEDLAALGRGYEGPYDEDKFGMIALDETSHFLNARSWGGDHRQPFLDWLTISGKMGWDTYFLAQGMEQLDKQFRTTLTEFHVPVRRLDRLKIPFVTALTGVRLPRMHIAFIKYGTDQHALTHERVMFAGRGLYKAYDTEQKFSDSYPHGTYCTLSPWHLVGRYLPPKRPIWHWPILFLFWLAFEIVCRLQALYDGVTQVAPFCKQNLAQISTTQGENLTR